MDRKNGHRHGVCEIFKTDDTYGKCLGEVFESDPRASSSSSPDGASTAARPWRAPQDDGRDRPSVNVLRTVRKHGALLRQRGVRVPIARARPRGRFSPRRQQRFLVRPPGGRWAIIAVSNAPRARRSVRAGSLARHASRDGGVDRAFRRARRPFRRRARDRSGVRPADFPLDGCHANWTASILQPPSRATRLAARRPRPDLARPRALSVVFAEKPSGLGRRTTRTASAPMSSSFSSSSRSGSACSP